MKPEVLWAALGAAFLAQGAAAQQATASSNQTANSVSGSASFGNVGNTTTNVMVPTATSNSNASTASTSTSNNAGNNQNNGSASSINATINVVTPPTSTEPGTLRQSVESNSRTEQVISGEQRLEYGGSYTIKNVPNVSAPPLASSNDTCMGSASGGLAVAGFGLTAGSMYTDEHCKRIKMSRELWNKGMKAASLAMDCMDRDARVALELTGYVCPQTVQARAAAEEVQRRAQFAVDSRRSSRAVLPPATPVPPPLYLPGEMPPPVAAQPAPAPVAAAPVSTAPVITAPAAALAPAPIAPAASPLAVPAAPEAAAPEPQGAARSPEAAAAAPQSFAQRESVAEPAGRRAGAEPPVDTTDAPAVPRAGSHQEAQDGTVIIRRIEGVEQLPAAQRQ